MRMTTCRTCLKLRAFLCAALPLIAMIYLQPEGAMRLAGHMPSPEFIGWGIVSACALGFWIRLRAFRRGALH